MRPESSESGGGFPHSSPLRHCFLSGDAEAPLPCAAACSEPAAAGNELLAEGVDPKPLSDKLECDCLFFRQYQLPCAHMWQQEHIFGGVLEDEAVWEDFVFMFEDGGFEIYEGREVIYSQKELAEEIGAPAKRRLEVSTLRPLQMATNTLF